MSKCLEDYPKYALAYGIHNDEHAGEQFSNHVSRMLISQFMRNRNEITNELLWATEAKSLKGQTEWYYELCKKAHNEYKKYLNECEEISASLTENGQLLFQDSLLLQVQIHYYCFTGAYYTSKSLLKAFEDDYQGAFYYAGLAKKNFSNADTAMHKCEHGKWHKFYQNECLTDIKQSAWVLGGLMSYLRNYDDGPHFYRWQREFLYSEEDRSVMLIMNMENHLKDEELFELMEEKWSE